MHALDNNICNAHVDTTDNPTIPKGEADPQRNPDAPPPHARLGARPPRMSRGWRRPVHRATPLRRSRQRYPGRWANP